MGTDWKDVWGRRDIYPPGLGEVTGVGQGGQGQTRREKKGGKEEASSEKADGGKKNGSEGKEEEKGWKGERNNEETYAGERKGNTEKGGEGKEQGKHRGKKRKEPTEEDEEHGAESEDDCTVGNRGTVEVSERDMNGCRGRKTYAGMGRVVVARNVAEEWEKQAIREERRAWYEEVEAKADKVKEE